MMHDVFRFGMIPGTFGHDRRWFSDGMIENVSGVADRTM